VTAPPADQGGMGEFTKPVLGIYEPSARAYAEKIRAGTATPSEISVSAGFMPVLLLELDSLRTRARSLEKVAVAARDSRLPCECQIDEMGRIEIRCAGCEGMDALDAALSELDGGK